MGIGKRKLKYNMDEKFTKTFDPTVSNFPTWVHCIPEYGVNIKKSNYLANILISK